MEQLSKCLFQVLFPSNRSAKQVFKITLSTWPKVFFSVLCRSHLSGSGSSSHILNSCLLLEFITSSLTLSLPVASYTLNLSLQINYKQSDAQNNILNSFYNSVWQLLPNIYNFVILQFCSWETTQMIRQCCISHNAYHIDSLLFVVLQMD